MSKINCEVIEDLLPLYVEDMVSPSSKVLVDEHLASCEICRQKKDQMGQSVQLPKDVDAKPLDRIRRKLFRKNATQFSMTALSVLLLAVLCVVHLNSPIAIPYEDVEDSITGQLMDNGKTLITMDDMGGEVNVEYGWDADGVRVQYINIYTTRLKQLLQVPSERLFFTMDQVGVGMSKKETSERLEQILNEDVDSDDYTVSINVDTVKEVQRVYYYPRENNGEAFMIYEDPDLNSKYHGGVVVLPRLTLNYYTLFAVALAGIGILLCVMLRKQKQRLFIMAKVTLLPVAYAISSMVILWGKNPIYDVLYYLSGILMATLVLYVMGYWIVGYVQYRKQQ